MTAEQTELTEKLNCLEFETSQLNHAYRLWRSYVERGTAPDWMAAAVKITYGALITFCLDTVSSLALDTGHAVEIECYALCGETAPPLGLALLAQDSMTDLRLRHGQGLQCDDVETDPGVGVTALVDGSLALTRVMQQNPIVGVLATEQTELIEKLNCLEFETSQLNHAYQLWRSYVERGAVPDWMAAAIRITYGALITFYLDTVSPLAVDTSHAVEIECYARSVETAPPLELAWLAQDSMTELYLHDGQGLQCDDVETDPGVGVTALVNGSLAFTRVMQQNSIVGVLAVADVPRAFSAGHLAQLEATPGDISGILAEESTTEEPYPELLPMTEPDWSGPEMAVVISPPSTGDAILEHPAIQDVQQEEVAGVELAAIHVPAALANWLRPSLTSGLFRAAAVAILMVAGGVVGIYVASLQRAAGRSHARSTTAGAVGIPAGEKAEIKFDPDPAVARLGSSFVLNAVLSRGSDIASVAAQIDYDANLLQFMGVSEGGFLAEAGRQFVLAQRNDPLTGVLKINAEQSPGKPGISGDGQVFALSFQAKRKGKATVSIVPGAHDSQGRRIETAGSQVSVTVR